MLLIPPQAVLAGSTRSPVELISSAEIARMAAVITSGAGAPSIVSPSQSRPLLRFGASFLSWDDHATGIRTAARRRALS